MTYREMEDGMGELEALRRFGRGILREYRKLALLLEQNLHKRNQGNFWRSGSGGASTL